jgi:hypothetical protein
LTCPATRCPDLATQVDIGRVSTKVADVPITRTPVSAGEIDPEDGLRAVVALREFADRLEDEHVERAISEGWSWARVAEALNVTRQAVHKKHGPRLRAAGIATGRNRNV